VLSLAGVGMLVEMGAIELGEAVRYLQQKLGSGEATPEAAITTEARYVTGAI